jgi:4-hydroxybenzoate polyprenyltransferase
MHFFVILPILQKFNFSFADALQIGMPLLLIIATVFIAAGGYVLNDYFDIKIDLINKPEKQIIGNTIQRKNAMVFYQILTCIGVSCGLILAFLSQSFTLAFIFIVTPGLLWFYSASYKRQFVIGNLIVAFIAALTILIVGISQIAFLEKEFGKFIFETPIPKQILSWISGFAFFSFLTTWIREIIKDIEDEKGDREMECRTLPIKLGHTKTKLLLFGLIILTVILLFIINNLFIQFEGTFTLRYIIFGIALPFFALSYLIFKAKTPADFHDASTLSKVIMLVGVLYGFIFYYLQAKTFGISFFDTFILK